MKQVVVLGTDLDTAVAYGAQHGTSQMYSTFIGDENAEENIMRNEDRSKQLGKIGLRFKCIRSKQGPQDCYALVHADEVPLSIFKEQQDSYRDYLKTVLPIRVKTNAGQPLPIRYKKEYKAKVLYFMNELYQAMQEEGTEWFHQMVNMQELAQSNEWNRSRKEMEIEIMNKLPIKKVVEGLLELQDTGESAAFLGIGPMLPNPLQANFETTRDYDFPLMFIASRNQVDADESSGGYVSGWNQKRFQDDIRAVAEQVGFDGLHYLCRDHRGPWQRDNERNAHLSKEEAMGLARQSYLADTESGLNLLMTNPTKDLFEIGKVISLDVVLQKTMELIAYCEEKHKRRNLPEIGYEIGMEETNGGLTSTEKYRGFIEKLEIELKVKGLPMPTFIVGQTGTLTRKTEQVGTCNFHNVYDLAAMAKAYGAGLKEHNTNYLDSVALLQHIPANIVASNVTPQYGTEETRAYLKLCEVEDILKREGLLEKTSSLRRTLLVKAIKTERWRK